MKKVRKTSARRPKFARTGIGYDIHRLQKGRPLILGGVQIESTDGLVGHSDADVLLHAICDALLGAACLGDIGQHFPDTDAQWKDASSLTLLASVGEKLGKKKFTVVHVDAVVVLEAPKIAPYRAQMVANIAKALRISKEAVSVKATTNEALGSLGRREGCASIATATIVPK